MKWLCLSRAKRILLGFYMAASPNFFSYFPLFALRYRSFEPNSGQYALYRSYRGAIRRGLRMLLFDYFSLHFAHFVIFLSVILHGLFTSFILNYSNPIIRWFALQFL